MSNGDKDQEIQVDATLKKLSKATKGDLGLAGATDAEELMEIYPDLEENPNKHMEGQPMYREKPLQPGDVYLDEMGNERVVSATEDKEGKPLAPDGTLLKPGDNVVEKDGQIRQWDGEKFVDPVVALGAPAPPTPSATPPVGTPPMGTPPVGTPPVGTSVGELAELRRKAAVSDPYTQTMSDQEFQNWLRDQHTEVVTENQMLRNQVGAMNERIATLEKGDVDTGQQYGEPNEPQEDPTKQPMTEERYRQLEYERQMQEQISQKAAQITAEMRAEMGPLYDEAAARAQQDVQLSGMANDPIKARRLQMDPIFWGQLIRHQFRLLCQEKNLDPATLKQGTPQPNVTPAPDTTPPVDDPKNQPKPPVQSQVIEDALGTGLDDKELKSQRNKEQEFDLADSFDEEKSRKGLKEMMRGGLWDPDDKKFL